MEHKQTNQKTISEQMEEIRQSLAQRRKDNNMKAFDSRDNKSFFNKIIGNR